MSKTFEVTANGNFMGEYRADDKESAINACCVDAGYDDIADCISVTCGSADEFEAFEIDKESVISAVEKAAGLPVFQDSYGDGIALVDGESYGSYNELAKAFDVEMVYV